MERRVQHQNVHLRLSLHLTPLAFRYLLEHWRFATPSIAGTSPAVNSARETSALFKIGETALYPIKAPAI
jgi:hypothetical protein